MYISSYPSVAGIFLEKLPELIEENVPRGFSLEETQRQQTNQIETFLWKHFQQAVHAQKQYSTVASVFDSDEH